jgi:hypothetical protein
VKGSQVTWLLQKGVATRKRLGNTVIIGTRYYSVVCAIQHSRTRKAGERETERPKKSERQGGNTLTLLPYRPLVDHFKSTNHGAATALLLAIGHTRTDSVT